MIEAFRDNGLNTLDHNAEINVSRLETILSSIYYQLNKRLPTTHQINVEQSIGLLLNFMVATYDRYGAGGQCRRALHSVGCDVILVFHKEDAKIKVKSGKKKTSSSLVEIIFFGCFSIRFIISLPLRQRLRIITNNSNLPGCYIVC